MAKVIGLLVAAISAVEGKCIPGGWKMESLLHYRKKKVILINGWPSQEMKVNLIWWLNHNSEGNRKILWKSTKIDLYTDASNLGWSGLLNHHQVNGRRYLTQAELHISATEFKAIFAIHSFTQHNRGKYVRVFCNNTTVVHHLLAYHHNCSLPAH